MYIGMAHLCHSFGISVGAFGAEKPIAFISVAMRGAEVLY